MSEDRDGIVWEEPPRKSPTEVFDGALTKVEEKAGEWARLHAYNSQSTAYSARKRLRGARTEAPWEFRVARIDGDGWGLYARYRLAAQMEEG